MAPFKKRKIVKSSPVNRTGSVYTSQTTDPSTQSNAKGSEKKGAKRRSDNKQKEVKEEPGDQSDTRTFIEIKRNEQKLAGYFGFTTTSDLRRFALSWPVVKAFLRFNKVSANLAKSQALGLIRDDEQKYQDEENPDKAWPLKNKGNYGDKSKDTAKRSIEERTEYDNRCSHVAWILLHMENDIKTYISYDEQRNSRETERFLLVLCVSLDEDTPEKCPGSPVPKMGPLTSKGESRLECISRCWSILKYIQEAKKTTGLWNNRFVSIERVSQGRTVDPSQIPLWMHPSTQEGPQPSEPPISVIVTWARESKFTGSDELEKILRMRSDENVRIPRARQVLARDPRRLKDGPIFRDTIRCMFSAAALGLGIRKLDLSWKSQGVNKTADTLCTYFEDLREVFNDESNSDFELMLLLEVREDQESDGYETRDLVVDT